MQSVEALVAYSDMWSSAIIPYSEYMWIIVILVTSLAGLYMARKFVTKF